jgi:ribosome-associated translation inhibitor RaiA
MGRSGRSAKRKSEGQKAATQKTATKKPPKSKPSKLKEKASNRYNVRALESHYGSIQKEYEHWGKKKREKVNGYGGTSGKQKPKKRQRTTIESTKKAPKKHNKMFQPNIILNMPKREAEGGIPWLKTPASAPPLTKRMKILNSISVDSHSMWLLDQELMNFSNYVQLAPQETQVRDHVIHAIQKGAMERFGITESDIQIFGSYAALQVCTFESDIDLAIWGLVGTNQSDPDPSGQAHAAKKDNTPYPQPKEPQPDHHNKKKQDRVLKWKAAIDEFERQKKLKEAEQTKDQNNDETQDSRAQSHQLTDADKNDAMRETIEAVSPLFVIDRAGADGKTSQSADADQKPAARTISKDDSQERKIPAWDDNAIDLIASFESSTHSDDDTADKLEGMKSRVDLQKATKNDEENQLQMLALPDAEGLAESTIAASANMDDIESAYADDDLYGVAEEGNEEEEEEMITTPRKRPRSRSLVSLSSATTCSDNHSLDETGLEVSFFNEPKRRFSASSHATKIGDDTRGLINSKLNQLTKTIRRTGVVTSIHVRKSARVPIINMETRYGFECDIALGGHNGNDTSAYAATQIARHPRCVALSCWRGTDTNLFSHETFFRFTALPPLLCSSKFFSINMNWINRSLVVSAASSYMSSLPIM